MANEQVVKLAMLLVPVVVGVVVVIVQSAFPWTRRLAAFGLPAWIVTTCVVWIALERWTPDFGQVAKVAPIIRG
jgi:hypothetical protein